LYIKRYKEIADYTKGKDQETHKIATQILKNDLEHEQDIKDWITDKERIKRGIKK